jgi:pimeloyl-ACP methyl ester carboxylesterase
MRTILRRIGVLALGLVLLLVPTAAGLVGWRALRQHDAARAERITTPDGIQQAGFVRIGGVDQWVQIRGEHRGNPVLLFVHGGPGFAMSPLTPVFRGWERDFTVVQWDQRDAGRTFSRNGRQPLSMDQVARDGLEVADYVRHRLGQPKIVVLGHSWGSAIALDMVHRRPGLFSAYVGTGQMVDKAAQETDSYAMVLARARAAGDRAAVGELAHVGPPPYRTLDELLVQRKWLGAYYTPAERDLFKVMAPLLVFAPGQSLRAAYDYNAAPKIAQAAAYDENARFDARAFGLTYGVPMFVFEGDQDMLTPFGPTRRWLDQIQAPQKAFVLLKGGAHDAVLTMPQSFLAELTALVRPVAMARSSTGS